MYLSVLQLNENKYEISITDTIDETSIFTFNFINNENNHKNDFINYEVNNRMIKFTSSNLFCISVYLYNIF